MQSPDPLRLLADQYKSMLENSTHGHYGSVTFPAQQAQGDIALALLQVLEQVQDLRLHGYI